MAHGVNGDPTRGFFVGTAIYSLATWYEIIHPGALWDDEDPWVFVSLPFNLVRLGLAWIVWFWLNALVHLVWRDSQRAEYLADYLAATVSGTDAMITSLEKTHLADSFYYTVHNVSMNWKGQNLFHELQQRVAGVPQEHLERLGRRQEERLEARLDLSHPPTAYRIGFLRAHPVDEPKVVLSPEDSKRLEQELASLQAPIQERLLDLHKDSLYW